MVGVGAGGIGGNGKAKEMMRRNQKEGASMKDKLLLFGKLSMGCTYTEGRGWLREQGLDTDDL